MINSFRKNLVKNYSIQDWIKFKKFITEQFHSKYILSDKEFFLWQYVRNPYTRRAAMKIIAYNDQFLGYLGLIPSKLNIFGTIHTSGCALCNLKISEHCRAFGLGSFLIKDVMEEYEIMWGTGYHPQTGPMYSKIGGWYLLGDLKRYIKIFNPKSIVTIIDEKFKLEKDKSVSEGNIKIWKIYRFSQEVNNFWKNMTAKYPISVEREQVYLNWRYVEHPSFQYSILYAQKKNVFVGYIIFRIATSSGGKKELRIGHIVDLVAENDAVQPLVMAAEDEMRKENADLIDYFSTGKFHHADFLNLGYHLNNEKKYEEIPLYFNPISKKRSQINFLVYCADSLKDLKGIRDINNWYITKGDGDKDRPNPQ